MRAKRQTELDGAGYCLAVHHGQGARQCQIYGAGLCVWLGTKGSAGAAEDFAFGSELGVGFKANDDFVAANKQRGVEGRCGGGSGCGGGAHGVQNPCGRRVCQSVAC